MKAVKASIYKGRPTKAVKHIVNFSGGIGSWAAAKRVVAQYGAVDTVLLFADTNMEDEDLYRFLDEAAVNVGAELIRISDGRTPWEVFRDVKFLGNSRVDPCSRILKREKLWGWIGQHYSPADCVIHFGIDWSEEHRLERQRERAYPWRVSAPLCEAPYLTKPQLLDWLEGVGIRQPRLYDWGFPHNNCGGFCIKAGQGHFAKLLAALPGRYREHEAAEQEFQRRTGYKNTILRDRRGGKNRPMTLKEFRERIEGGADYDRYEFGGCGCAMSD